MPDSLAVDIQASLHWLFQDNFGLTTLSDRATLEYAQSLADGVGADQADRLWHAERTLAAGASDSLDLTALAATIFGNSVTSNFAKVKALLLVNTATTAGHDLHVGGAGSGGNAWAAPWAADADAKNVVPADSSLLLVNKKSGWTVTPGTGDILRVHNAGAASVTYRIAIVGTTT